MNEAGSLFAPQASWIGTAHPFDLHEAYLCFRSPPGWQLEQRPQSAKCLITADSRYRLWVNGRFVARGPARCYPQYQSVDVIDITPFLRAGTNRIAVQVYQPGYSHFSYVHRGAAGLLLQVDCDGQTAVASGPAWRARRDPSFAELVPRVSIYGAGVEQRELALDEPWTQVDFDDAGWPAARVVAQIGAAPWTSLQERDLPMLPERPLEMALLQMRRGFTAAGDQRDAHLALREAWFSAEKQPDPPANDGWLGVNLQEGESALWLFDLGRDYTCLGWAEIEGAGGRERFSISYAETMRGGELVLSDPQTYCRVRLTDRWRLRPGEQIAEPFSMRGGRYLLFYVHGPSGPDFRFRPAARMAAYPLEISRPLKVEDDLLQGVIDICENTFMACLQDGFVDSTWRESSQWVGDALPQSLIMSAMSDDVRPLRRVIEMAAQGAYPDGLLPSVLPGEVHAYTVVDYNFMWVELLRLYQQLADDAPFVGRMWPVLRHMLERFQQDLDQNGLLVSQPGRRLFLDWAPLSRQEPHAVYNLHYLYALQEAMAIAAGLGLGAEIERLNARAAALQQAIRAAFWQDGRWFDDRQRSTFSQLAAAFALLTGTAEAGEREALLAAILERSLDPADDPGPQRMVLASPFMHHYIFEALRGAGWHEQVLAIIRLRWGRWVEGGYPTTWENWQVDFPDGSQCHAFSAHPRYHLAQIFEE